MKFFDKLKWLVSHRQPQQTTQPPEEAPPLPQNPTSTPPLPSEEEGDWYLHPITTRVKQWLDGYGFKYDHQPSETDKDTHHLVLGFAVPEEGRHDWLCVVRINENNCLVSILGISEKTVSPKHYAQVLLEICEANTRISYGNLELDVSDGEFRAKLAFDAEFAKITDRMMDSYWQGLGNLMELIDGIHQKLQDEEQPLSFEVLLTQYLAQKDNQETDESGFFVPTTVSQ